MFSKDKTEDRRGLYNLIFVVKTSKKTFKIKYLFEPLRTLCQKMVRN